MAIGLPTSELRIYDRPSMGLRNPGCCSPAALVKPSILCKSVVSPSIWKHADNRVLLGEPGGRIRHCGLQSAGVEQPLRAPGDASSGAQCSPAQCLLAKRNLSDSRRWTGGSNLAPGVFPCASSACLAKARGEHGRRVPCRTRLVAGRESSFPRCIGGAGNRQGSTLCREKDWLGHVEAFRLSPPPVSYCRKLRKAMLTAVRCVQWVAQGRERGQGGDLETGSSGEVDQPLGGVRQFLGGPVGKVVVVVCVSLFLGKVFGPGRLQMVPDVGETGKAVSMSLDNTCKGVLAWSAASWPKLRALLGLFRDQGPLLAVLLVLSAFFACAETAITTLWPWKVRELAEKEKDPGGVFTMLRRDVTRFLTTALIGSTATNIAATALVTDAVTQLFGEAGIGASTGVMTVVILLLTEIAPKSIAVHNATEVARVVIRPVAWFSIILYPVGRACTVISMALLKFLGLKSSKEPFVTEEELKLVLSGAEMSGAIEEEEQDMIENVLELEDTPAREVMTPLVDVVAIDSEATLMDLRNLWVKHKYSRVPVFEKRVDNIVGVVYAMDMLDYVEQLDLMQTLTVGRIARKPAYFVPDSMSFWTLLREFRIRKVHMAIVVNEYGGTAGLVTLEDVVEEIVGEIYDENDSKEEIRKRAGYVVQIGDGVYDVDANTSVEDLEEEMGVEVPEGTHGPHRYETVSGFVCEAFGYIPRPGEAVEIALKHRGDPDEEGRSSGEDKMGGGGTEGGSSEARPVGIMKYRLKVLSGNVRKVGSVRFERLGSVDTTKNKWDASSGGRERKGLLPERKRWQGLDQGLRELPSQDETLDGLEGMGLDVSRGDGSSSPVTDEQLTPAISFPDDDIEDGYVRNRMFIVDNLNVDVSDTTTVSCTDGLLEPITRGEVLENTGMGYGSTVGLNEKGGPFTEGIS
ncbi:hypothetical protein CBR_g22294 [Chara braunii]|uniref:CNNM transmembrane domain-containing protein n=1 Tax=Chara braunii TaxID=69332 RepID=A0A388L2N3_CHABU|nr:hypothetical protein CBR_g22294 [Chara braunii]|eukprot:GBG76546.1 hypothetical protein CBR_g22294 [Chara braunii]